MHRVRHKIIVLKKLNIEKQYFSALATLCLGLAACGGVPLHAIPRLLQMQNERLTQTLRSSWWHCKSMPALRRQQALCRYWS